eukprot:jgi/Astpho2/545/Aster-x0938
MRTFAVAASADGQQTAASVAVVACAQAGNQQPEQSDVELCRRKRVRVSGFRARKLTHGGRNVIKARRKKGRHTICPAYLFKKP